MWLLRELARLVIRTAVIAGVTLALALGLAAVGAGSFHADARILCIAFGAMLLAMAGVGSGSNIERFADQGVLQVAWGTIPGFDALNPRRSDPRIAPGPAFFLSGLVLIAIGIAL